MKIFGLSIGRKDVVGDIDSVLSHLHAAYDTYSGVRVTPENCMQAPTVQAIVQAVSRRICTLPIWVIRKSTVNNRNTVERLPNHPVAKLLKNPNDWQTDVQYWMDLVSLLVRYGNFYAFKTQGNTGPIKKLLPLHPATCKPKQGDDWTVTYEVNNKGVPTKEYALSEIHHIRGPARNGIEGDSPVFDVREAIAMEIAAEKFGAAFLGNGAMPFLLFKFMQGVKGFKSEADEKKFVSDFQEAYGGRKRFRALALPVGMDVSAPINIENEKAQFLDTRKYQRAVIAGAWGVPPHLVGDLERGTFNNVEQQSLDFVLNVVHPYVRMCESSMEADLLTDEDRNNNVCIRLNLDAALRGDFKTRQEGLAIQRQWGIISANDWRETENMNPITGDEDGTDEDGDNDGGDEYIRPMNFVVQGQPVDTTVPPVSRTAQEDATTSANKNAELITKLSFYKASMLLSDLLRAEATK